MGSQLVTRGIGRGPDSRLVGRVTRLPVASDVRAAHVKIVSQGESDAELDGYSAVLAEPGAALGDSVLGVRATESLEFLSDGDIAVVNPAAGFVRTVYRPKSRHNFLFATERCNSACIMCSQPPREVEDDGAAAEMLRIIDLVPDKPEHLGISGGEPTLLGEGIVRVVEALGVKLPETAVTMLSNGRRYSDEALVAKLAAVRHPCFMTSVPIHGDNASDHDFVAQARGAFDETVSGLYNAARHSLAVELRVVLHAFTVPALSRILEFAYRNLSFVRHIALMGLEDMGYARSNRNALWLDPVDYGETLREAVEYCHYRRIPVSLYNLPLCVLPQAVWGFARQSISDHKNIYLDECTSCCVREHCAGMFQSSRERHSRGIKAVT